MKQLMAVSGTVFVAFVILHCYGNLKMFAGQEAYDGYAEHLRTFGEPILPYGGLLWILRIVLIACVILHVGSAVYLTMKSSKARNVRYAVKKMAAKTYSARTMRVGGFLLFVFIIFHILHFTTLSVELGGSYANTGPYERFVMSFQLWYVWLIYLIALSALSLHIEHGVASALQTMGWVRKNTRVFVRAVSGLVAAFVFVGFMAPPTAVLLGIIH